MIHIECPCGRSADVPEAMAGKKGLCQSCGKVIVIPHPKAAGGRRGAAPAAAPKAQQKKNVGVGLDKECERCGDTVSYAYRGPVEGLCGKCADREMAERRRKARGKKVKRMVNGFEVEDWEEESKMPWKAAVAGILVLALAGVLFVLWKTGNLRIPGL